MATAPKTKTVPGIRVASCSPRETFRRAGLEFTRAPVDLPIKDLTKDQLAAIRAEKMLVVVDVQIEVAADTAGPAET